MKPSLFWSLCMNLNKIKAYFKMWYTLEKRLQHYLTLKITLVSTLKSIFWVALMYLIPVLILISLYMFSLIHVLLTVLLIITAISSIWVYYIFFGYYIKKASDKIALLPLSKIFIVEKIGLSILIFFISIWVIILTGVFV
jgi:hypothetical protein